MAKPQQPQQPQRCYTIKVKAGGDTWQDALRQLIEIVTEVESHGPECRLITGGSSSGGFVEIYHDPTMTHENYFKTLEAYEKRNE